jgi:biopolymer transport protein ExbD
MSTGRSTGAWRVRVEGAAGEGRPLDFATLSQQVADGAWQETDQVRDPTTGRWGLIGNHPHLEEFLPTSTRLRARPEDDPEMDITPMIDVTFQLIIFFMITATFVVQKTMDMPQAEANEPSSQWRPTWNEIEEQYLVVHLAEDGTITVDDEPVDLEDLPVVLAQAAGERELAERALTVHDDVPHELVVGVLDAAGGAEIERVHFARGATSADGPPATEASVSPAP